MSFRLVQEHSVSPWGGRLCQFCMLDLDLCAISIWCLNLMVIYRTNWRRLAVVK